MVEIYMEGGGGNIELMIHAMDDWGYKGLMIMANS
jgi:hypothetical protein